MQRLILSSLLLATLLMLSSGCAHDPDNYGQSYQQWFEAQVKNPDAPANPSPAATLPGEIAMEIQKKRYIPMLTEKKKDNKGKVQSQFDTQSND
ncbi:hypothetical protein [Desulfobacca acetoxidans]|uniref:Lipoprotein n=1 Tax=Desulfobacca acetoxidans (strain ATCC 700848 / DSM 11109 / ASRB2) TaxID=880072 RepID=F2NFA6_DESAR|nr:hypothetical protein [Desulfobacca acetoxidans]AEB08661.1 hypothetical protein Desac_0782 [Desulfobacca acetoxidans DSM 11109]